MEIEEILTEILQREGGFVQDPSDRGGATKYGITLRTLSAWRQEEATVEDVKNLTIPEAKEIYRERYVAPFEGEVGEDLLPQVVDIAVLHGVGRARQWVRRLRAAGRLTNGDLLKVRMDFIADIVKHDPEQRKFLKGWLRRALAAAEV